MSLATVVGNIGREADLRTADFTVRVRVTDAKVAYGSPRYTVVPVAGSGSTTVDACRLTFAPRQFTDAAK